MTTLQSPYRNDATAAELRYGDLLADRLREVDAATDLARVHGRRIGRMAAGVAGIVGALLMVMKAVAIAAAHMRLEGKLSPILFGSWGAMGVAYAAGRAFAKVRSGRTGLPARSGDPWTDVARLEAPLVRRGLSRQVDRLEQASVALPMIALSLLAPLTVHACVYACWLALGGQLAKFADFDGWIAISLCIVGHAHLVHAWFCYRFAKKMRALPYEKVEVEGYAIELRAFWYTVSASAVPGALALLLPPALTFLTGLVVNPAMFRIMRDRIVEERQALNVR